MNYLNPMPCDAPHDETDLSTLKLKIALTRDVELGPGKADLLAAIAETGSIAAAGRRMGMSYKRAWTLVDALNAVFADTLVESSRGGPRGGGAQLTEMGKRVLRLYREVELKAAQACTSERNQLTQLLRSKD